MTQQREAFNAERGDGIDKHCRNVGDRIRHWDVGATGKSWEIRGYYVVCLGKVGAEWGEIFATTHEPVLQDNGIARTKSTIIQHWCNPMTWPV